MAFELDPELDNAIYIFLIFFFFFKLQATLADSFLQDLDELSDNEEEFHVSKILFYFYFFLNFTFNVVRNCWSMAKRKKS